MPEPATTRTRASGRLAAALEAVLPGSSLPRRLPGGVAGAAIGLVAGAIAAAAAPLGLVETYERRTLDLRTRVFADARRADRDIVAVVIDQKSLDAVAAPRERGGLEQGWPWPRDFHAAVLRYLLDAGARAVAFDLMFSERSIYTQLGVADDDTELAAAAAGAPVVHAVMLTRESPGDGPTWRDRTWPEPLRDPRHARTLPRVPPDAFNKATLPVPPIADTAARLGWIGFEPDEDGICRSIQPSAAYAPHGAREAALVWALPLAVLAALGPPVAAGEPATDRIVVNGRAVPLDAEGRLLLRFHGGEGTYRQFSYAKVLEAAKRRAAGALVTAAGPEEFRGKVVLIGATAAGLLDFRPTSIGGILPGYVIHATALDNLLHGDALRRPPYAARAAVLLALGTLAGTLAGALFHRAWALRAATLATAALALAYLGVVLWAFAARGVWLDLAPPALALALAYGGVTGYGYLTEERERRFLRDAFSRYLAREVVEALVADPRRLALGGETREVTVMFADVAGFTTLAEAREPGEVVALMNECFTELTGIIQAQGGTVDKFMGDAVMAFWNAPVYQPNHAARACRAARELLVIVDRLADAWEARGLPRLSMRIGLATGPAVVGNVGSRTRVNYTAMGDTVNLASRLEAAAKVYATRSLVAGSTVDAAQDPAGFRELDWLHVKGRSRTVVVYEILPAGTADPVRAEACRGFAAGLAAYRARRFEEAAGHFEATLAQDAQDGPTREMLARCRAFLVDPPPPDWQGAYALATK